MAHIVHCRLCKQEIDVDARTDWMMPSRNFYYHCSCYHEWINRKENRITGLEFNENEWLDLLKDYIYRDQRMPGINWAKVCSQWNNLLEKNSCTPKGIYFSVIYYYEILKGDPVKAQGGIGIVKSIYNESANYWIELERKRAGAMEDIMRQLTERANRSVLTIGYHRNSTTAKKKYNLEDI